MLDAETIGVTVARDWQDLYDAFWRPAAFTRWASGLSGGNLRDEGGRWRADGPEGPVTIRFSGHNAFGVLDHWVEVGGLVISVPMRIVANGAGALVLLTLFRQPGMSEAKFAADRAWVARDLAALKRLAES